MRILSNDYYSSTPNSSEKIHGGPRRFSADFSHFARREGHEWIGLIRSNEALEGMVQEIASREGARYIGVYVPKVTLEGLRELQVTISPDEYLREEIAALIEHIREIAPDVLFLNGFSAYSWLLYAAARACHVPIVIQHAGIMHHEVEQYADLFTDAGRAMCIEMERDTALGVSANIFLNKFSEQEFLRCLALESVPGSVIVPLPHAGWTFAGTKTFHEGEIVLGAVARWDRIKNHAAILALAEEIQRQGLPWKIRVVTAIPDTPMHAQMKESYRALIEVVPPMDRDQLLEFYRSLDIAILPSHFDVSPTVVMEALSQGVPTLISPQVGWVSEYEECDMHEWIASFDNPEKVVAKISALLSQKTPQGLEKLAVHVEKCHNPGVIYERYMQMFEGLTRAENPERAERKPREV